MVSITDEIISKLKSHTFSVPLKDVRDFYSTKDPEYPMIAIDEVTNTPSIQILGDEKISTIGYKFEIYTRDISVDGKVYSKRQASYMILHELDALLRETYGFRRSNSPTVLPYGSDGSIMRNIVIYVGKIDNENMILYQ